MTHHSGLYKVVVDVPEAEFAQEVRPQLAILAWMTFHMRGVGACFG